MLEQAAPSREDLLKETYLSETFEFAWRTLPLLLRSLPFRKKLEYKKELAADLGLSARFSGWRSLLDKNAEALKTSDKRLNASESRLYVMMGRLFYFRVLKDLGEIIPEEGGNWDVRKCSAFVTVMQALNSTLPWNRTGRNPVTPNMLTVDTTKEAKDYIHQLGVRLQ
jgi:hypothetical protein